MALRGREAWEPVRALEAVELFARELAAPHGEGADELVVAAGDVAGTGGLGDLRIVELGRVAVDVEDPAADARERLDDEVLEDSLLGRARSDPVAPDRVEADLGSPVARRADQSGEARQDILEHGHAVS